MRNLCCQSIITRCTHFVYIVLTQGWYDRWDIGNHASMIKRNFYSLSVLDGEICTNRKSFSRERERKSFKPNFLLFGRWNTLIFSLRMSMASCYLYARENSSLKITLSTTVYSILYGLCLVIIDMPWIAPFRPGKKQFVCSSIFANYSNRTIC